MLAVHEKLGNKQRKKMKNEKGYLRLKSVNGLTTGPGSDCIYRLHIHHLLIICRLDSVVGAYHNDFSIYKRVSVTDLYIRNWITLDLDLLALQD